MSVIRSKNTRRMKRKSMFRIVKHEKRGICVAHGCNNKRKGTTRLCSRHNHIRRSIIDPIGHVFDKLKCNAKRRGKVFTLTRSQFEEIIDGTGYMENRGRTMTALTLDRIDPLKGYEYGNVRVISQFENSFKGGTEDKAAHSDDLPF